ncbi:MAG: cyclodeaminase/cyclohydrolase family protein [Acidobacteriota bacterium]
MLQKLTLEEFSDRLASGTPTPGGGSAAALSGAVSASLIRMVCDLTIGREAYRAHEEELRSIRRRAEGLRRDLLALVDRDAQAYDGVVRAMRMPKGSDPEREARAAAIRQATLFATETPMATAEGCAALIGLAVELIRKGNRNAVSDAGSAALFAYGGLRSAVMNVRINLPGLEDAARAARARERVRGLEVGSERLREEALSAMAARLNGD